MSESRLRLIPLGVGEAFTALHYTSSYALGLDDQWLLVDCSHPIRKMLRDASLASGVTQVQAGTLLALALSGEQRSPLLPTVPTFTEADVPRYDMSYWWGLAAPAGTLRPIIERLHREVVRACAQPRLREAFLQQAATAATSTPEEMTGHLKREIEVWRELIHNAKISLQ